ncbi:MAG: regulatory protein RecX [Oscillospiraceae bacterium]|nr:regulatory protein RecX [Oscillospiraceae bacterium]
MIVTKIEAYGGKSKFSKIFADGEYIISLPPELIERFSLKVGVEIDQAELKKLSEAALVRRARERLLYSLDRRLHSEKELRQKLRQNYPPQIIDAAISELSRLGLVNDEAFARAFAEQRLHINKKGPYAIVSELILKGVDKQLARAVVDELTSDCDDEYKSALAVAQRYKKDLDTPKGKQRLYGALARRGFSYSVVKRVMQEAADITYFEE